MYCEKAEKNGVGVYSILLGMAAVRGIDVYEIDASDSVSGIFYNYTDEGIPAKVFMVSRNTDKEYCLARLLANYVLSKNSKGYVISDKSLNNLETGKKADRIAKKLIALLERRCRG